MKETIHKTSQKIPKGVKVTIRQRRTAAILQANPSMPIKRAMIQAGYSEQSASIPNQALTETKGWKYLMGEFLGEDRLINKHSSLLEATKVISANVFPDGKDGKPVNDFIEVPDNRTQMEALALAYKITGKTSDSLVNVNILNHLDTQKSAYELV